MKIDLHVHCRPASLCSHHQPEEIPAMFKAAGLGGFVLTNHYYPNHLFSLGDTPEVQAGAYIDVWRRAYEAGKKIGISVLFGAEVKLMEEPNEPEFLLYGFTEKQMKDSYPLYHLSQKELFDYCNANDILMYQSHPFRIEQGYAPADPAYMHGVEVYNPHLLFPARFEEALALAKENGKLMSAGSDFHEEAQAGLSGMIVPDGIGDAQELRDFLRENKPVIFDKDGLKDLGI